METGDLNMSEKTILDEIIEALKGKKTLQATNELIEQLKNERALFDRFRNAGLTVTTEDLQGRARLRPEGILSKVEKVDLIDLITRIALISEITHIGTIDTIDKINSIDNFGDFTQLYKIVRIDKLNPSEAVERIVNGGFETGDGTGWVLTGATITSAEKHSGTYSCTFVQNNGILQYTCEGASGRFLGSQIKTWKLWAKGTIGKTLTIRLHVDSFDLLEGTYTFTTSNWEEIDVLALITPDPDDLYYATAYINFSLGTQVWVDDITLTISRNVVIDEVKSMRGREDLEFKPISYTFGAAGYYEVLPLYLSKRHKIYAYGIRISSARDTYFVEGTSATRQFGHDNTTTPRTFAFLYPFVCAEGTALQFYSSGTGAILGWIQYITEP